MKTKITRLNELLVRELSLLLHRDYREECSLLTITRVSLAPDLQNCTVFFSTPRDDIREDALRFLQKNCGKIKQYLSTRIRMKYFPALRFSYDKAMEKELRVQDVLNSLS
ncbi:MAG: 30S ribosome-binding factor RbfA [Puniceicoccales bacterium]|jgi:ribosome-binding factor A|nr:30S ribosome-binding factor RbfA [Puniceicoccales bacterium]